MRLDKFLVSTGVCSRSEAKTAIKKGLVKIDSRIANDPTEHIDPEVNIISYKGEPLLYRKYTYIMLNKPQGVVSATNDISEKTVIDLLPENLRKIGLFPCGRLDKNTVGLLILTNNGELAHKLLSPKRKVAKTYRFETKFPLSNEDVLKLEAGVDIGGYVTKPCKVELEGEKSGKITIIEGKYHQIKLMMNAVNNSITFLERITFGGIKLDTTLERGQWRYLSDEEQRTLEKPDK